MASKAAAEDGLGLLDLALAISYRTCTTGGCLPLREPDCQFVSDILRTAKVLSAGCWYQDPDIGYGTLIISNGGTVRTTSYHVFDAGTYNPIRIFGGTLSIEAEG